MSLEPILQRLRDDSLPSQEQQDRVRMLMQRKIQGSNILERAKQEATPSTTQHQLMWQRVRSRIANPAASSIFGRVRALFSPSDDQRFVIRERLMGRLAPVEIRSSYVRTKWVAAFALVLVALRISPVLFLAPRTIAESTVLLVPTRGNAELLLHDFWQGVTDEVALNEAVHIRTEDGEATILLHDDGTVRMSPNATLALHDLSDRPEPALDGATMTLQNGKIWLQGLLPDHLRGITVHTQFGDVTVHGGSVSIALEEELTVRVWDRSAVVVQGSKQTTLIAGEKARFGSNDSVGQITRISDDEYAEAWVAQNLQRDAVHQRAIAQMQQERRAAQAGILPTSPLYSVKRVAEKVDVLLTLDPEAKIQKQLELASTRLNEAAALIAEGSEGADVQMEEYKQTLLTIASGSGGSSVTQFLVRQKIAENAADLSAAQPNDDFYLLKRVVLEASAELPEGLVDESDMQGVLLVDTLGALREAIASGDTAQAEETYAAIAPYLSALGGTGALKPDVRKEVLTLLSDAAQKLQQQTGTGIIADQLADDLKPYLPKPQKPAVVPLTDQQVDDIIAHILDRIFVYSQQRSRWNQLQYELTQLKGHPDEGRILRRLYDALPENGLARYVRTAIQELRNGTR